MSQSQTPQPCLHREEHPIRGCKSCGAYLTSVNPTDECWQCGGWGEYEMDGTWHLLAEAPHAAREDFFAELMQGEGIAV